MSEQRTDWLMRQFCDQIADELARGMTMHDACAEMTERGVPRHVQMRICSAAAPG